ncbi:tyrosine-type recombinase/integrase [Vibrio sp. TRT 1302]|uniref:tyrosine-type recombinase/integrase n=1 Tax=Vibrio sp. TRT 1302 TaxID=3418504 RepID=UPI003CF96F32
MRKTVRVITDEALKKNLVSKFSSCISLDDVDELTEGNYARNSLLAMRKDWNLFVEFCVNKHVCPLPASATAVRLFLEKESQHRKLATIKRYSVTISLIHRVLADSDPTSSVAVRTVLSQLRINKKQDAKSTTPFTRSHLDDLAEKLANSTQLSHIRNLAIYFVMFECMLKRSELKKLSFQDLECGEENICVILGQNQYPLSSQATQYMNKWLAYRGIHQGALFSAIDKHGNLNSSSLDDSSIYRILRAASDKLGLDLQFSGQSLRVGAVAEMADQGVKVKDIQHFGRWQSAAMPYQYLGNRTQAAAERLAFKSFKPWN